MGGGKPLIEYLRIVRRRAWIVVLCVVLAPCAALAFSLTQSYKYKASAQVLLNEQNLAASLAGVQVQNQTAQAAPERVVETQAQLASTPPVAASVLHVLGLERNRTPAQLLASTSIVAEPNADILDISVTDHNATRAVRLVNEYALQYTLYRRQLDTQTIVAARTGLEHQISALQARGEQSGSLYSSLVVKDQELRTMQALQTSNASVARKAQTASQVQPKPVRDGLLGLVLGLGLGIGLALAAESIDTRMRSGEMVAERLGLPVLGRLAEPPGKLQTLNELAMLAEPTGLQAESFRMLSTSLNFVNLERGARKLMITSAAPSEGKSTTAANLAIALARAGRHTVLVDLDMRRPYMHRFFDLRGHPGIGDVVVGNAQLEEACVPIVLAEQSPDGHHSASGYGKDLRVSDLSQPVGNGNDPWTRLEVIGAGSTPPNPGEFVGASALGEILGQLSGKADMVIVDSPPLLGVGDALTLSARMDAILLVCRLDLLRRPMVHELRKVVESLPVPALGVILAAAQLDEGYGYASYYSKHYYGWHGGQAKDEKLRERT